MALGRILGLVLGPSRRAYTNKVRTYPDHGRTVGQVYRRRPQRIKWDPVTLLDSEADCPDFRCCNSKRYLSTTATQGALLEACVRFMVQASAFARQLAGSSMSGSGI